MADYPLYDDETKKFFKDHPYAVTTVEWCEICHLFYKPILGHKCKQINKKENKK